MSQRNIEVLGEFIELYKSEPCLWKVKADDYHNRDKRDAAYRKLVMKLKEIEPDANGTLVKNKINSLRSNVRKEQKKIDSSMKSGASADNVYKPSLWYFKLFDFLKDQNNPKSSVSNLSPEKDNDEDEDEQEYIDDSSAINSALTNCASPVFQSVPKRNKPSSVFRQNEPPPNAACSYLAPNDSEEDIIAKVWIFKLKRMKPEQRLYAEKFITEILLEGELGTLHRQSVKINEIVNFPFMQSTQWGPEGGGSPSTKKCWTEEESKSLDREI